MTDATNFQIIGIDCAANPMRNGVAFAHQEADGVAVERITFGRPGGVRWRRITELAETISSGIDRHRPTLLAIDAPLGWPVAMSRALASHTVGSSTGLVEDPRLFFRRLTDRFVHRVTGKRPLDFGTSFVASAAHAALRILGQIEGHPPVALQPLRASVTPDTVVAIEVHAALALPLLISDEPASTNTKWDWKALSDDMRNLRNGSWVSILEELSGRLGVHTESLVAASHDPQGRQVLSSIWDVDDDERLGERCRNHGLDAVLCAWTGARFLRGGCVAPEDSEAPRELDRDELRQEGWIWFDRRVLRTTRGEASVESPSGV